MSRALVPATGSKEVASSPATSGTPSEASAPVSLTKRPASPPPTNSPSALPVQVPGAKPRFSKAIAPPRAAVQGKSPTVMTTPPTQGDAKPESEPAKSFAKAAAESVAPAAEMTIEDAVFEMANRMREAAKAQASTGTPKSFINQEKSAVNQDAANQGEEADEPARADKRAAKAEHDMNTNPSTINAEADMDSDSERAPKHETEIVLGRRQLASVAFVVVAFLGIVAMLSYLIGRASSTESSMPMAPVAIGDLPVANGEAPEGAAGGESAEDVPVPPEAAAITSAPIFAAPAVGDRYLQVGSVNTGVAQLMVEGLRVEGLNAIATDSASGQDHKVLVGPVNTDAEMSQARQKLNEMNLQWFVRN